MSSAASVINICSDSESDVDVLAHGAAPKRQKTSWQHEWHPANGLRRALPTESDEDFARRLQREEEEREMFAARRLARQGDHVERPAEHVGLKQRLLAKNAAVEEKHNMISARSSGSTTRRKQRVELLNFDEESGRGPHNEEGQHARSSSSGDSSFHWKEFETKRTHNGPDQTSTGQSFDLGRFMGASSGVIRRVSPQEMTATTHGYVGESMEVFGTAREPLLIIRNVDHCRGRMIAGRVLDELLAMNRPPPVPRQGRRGSIVAEWHCRKRSPTPWRTDLRALADFASEVLAALRKDTVMLERFPGLQQQRPWNDSEVLVTTPGCTLGRHTDAQPEGSLLLVFCAGLSCRSQAWPAGKLVERTLESGDVMILDGSRTVHAIPGVIGGTSPVPRCPWLGNRRLSVLVRQSPPFV